MDQKPPRELLADQEVNVRLKISLFTLFLLAGCQTNPPVREYTLARTALDSAKRIEAVRIAPAYFHKAEEAFRRAELEFKREEYSEAKDHFTLAREYAEKAENSARLQRTGEDK
ncbi:MAG: DUF4398 domain-containing protein [Bdellovibrionia bacterium]